ncbi:MAG: hypothetical protein ACRDFQ_01145, partial [Anaerolineales bacterium]
HGLCGEHDPASVVSGITGSEQRLSILTLGTVLDINPLTQERWSGLASVAGQWLLDPSQVAYKSSHEVLAAMQDLRILGPRHVARVWWQLCRGVQGRFKGSWGELIAANQGNAQTLQRYLEQSETTFPVLAGPVISARWLDLVHRIGGLTLQDWENLRVPLPKELLKAADQFNIKENEVHPMLYNALWLWPVACKQQPEDSCGLVDCPLRH